MLLKDVEFTAEWDLDGDSRYPGSPRFLFLDTGAHWMDMYANIRVGGAGVHIVGTIRADDFQIRQELDVTGAFTVLINPLVGLVDTLFKTAGSFCGNVQSFVWLPGVNRYGAGTHGLVIPAGAAWCRF